MNPKKLHISVKRSFKEEENLQVCASRREGSTKVNEGHILFSLEKRRQDSSIKTIVLKGSNVVNISLRHADDDFPASFIWKLFIQKMADDKEAEIVPGPFTRDRLPVFDQSITGFGEIRES